jgi:hypothetical protein
LAAFASKQVMCALDYTTHTKMRAIPLMDLSLDLSKQFLGMGNFWLFQDIFCLALVLYKLPRAVL